MMAPFSAIVLIFTCVLEMRILLKVALLPGGPAATIWPAVYVALLSHEASSMKLSISSPYAYI